MANFSCKYLLNNFCWYKFYFLLILCSYESVCQADDIRNEANELLRIRDYHFNELAMKTGQPFEKVSLLINKSYMVFLAVCFDTYKRCILIFNYGHCYEALSTSKIIHHSSHSTKTKVCLYKLHVFFKCSSEQFILWYFWRVLFSSIFWTDSFLFLKACGSMISLKNYLNGYHVQINKDFSRMKRFSAQEAALELWVNWSDCQTTSYQCRCASQGCRNRACLVSYLLLEKMITDNTLHSDVLAKHAVVLG